MESANIYEGVEYSESKPKVTVLFETNFTKEIRIVMQQGTIMKEHKTAHPIVVEILEGNIDFGIEQQIRTLIKGDIIALEGNIPHDLKANNNSIVRLTLTKYDNANRVKGVAVN